uniref:Mediator of DNA damage checkpoint protein 1 n=1 Tax=Oryzias melastigma TaxID=30732 RepID=A0A3B3C609_ORYME
MDATQAICDSILESDDEEKEEKQSEEERPVAKLCILKNPHIPEAELPLTFGDNILGRDHNTCSVPLAAPSVSKQHATISVSAYRRKGCQGEMDMEVLVWDLGSMNGTRKGRLKLTPHVRYALTEGDSLVVADIPCQYVSCSAESTSSLNDTRTPESRKSKGKAELYSPSGEKRGTTSGGSKDCVNGGANTRVSFGRTPVRGPSCLSFEQTPTQPEGTLVPESDSDTDDEKERGGHRKLTHLASDSDSHKQSFNSSTFLSPASKIVPESEDESPCTPSSFRYDSRQHSEMKRSPVISEEDHRSARQGTTSEEGERHDSSKGAELSVSTPELSRDPIPAFSLDNDVEEGASSKEPQCSNTNKEIGQPPNTDLFCIDSDTDVDEDQDAAANAPDLSSGDSSKPPLAALAIQPEGDTSDTDVDDAVSETAAASFQTAHTADSEFLAQARDFHLDSDTDVDEEEGCDTETKKSSTPPDMKPESAPHTLEVKTDTANKEAVFNSDVAEPSVATVVTPACTAADAGTHLDILSDSDTDVDESSATASGVVTNSSAPKESGIKEALQSDSDADTDMDESSVSNAGKRVEPADLEADSDADIKGEEAEENLIPDLQRENTPGLQLPLLHNCSTPVQISAVASSAVRPVAHSPCSDSQEEEDLEVAETQFFGHQPGIGQSSASKADKRSSRGDSFQLDLSDSGHLQSQGRAGTTESTQAFVFTEGAPNMEDTQVYAAVTAGDESNMEATQVYGDEEEPAQCSEVPGKTDLAFEATQAYISEPSHISAGATLSNIAEAETQLMPSSVKERSLEKNNLACSSPEPTSRTGNEKERREHVEAACMSVAETQPMCTSEYEEREDELLLPAVQKRRGMSIPPYSSSLSLSETQPLAADDNRESDEYFRAQRSEAKQQLSDTDETQRLTDTQVSSTTETQLYSVNEDDDDADSAPGLQRRKTKPLQLDESPNVETHDSELSDEEDSIPCFRKHKAKPLQSEEESTQPLVSSEASAVDSLSGGTELDQEGDNEDSAPALRKRKAKELHSEEEKETQPLTNSEGSCLSETQPAAAAEDDSEDFIPGLRRRKAKPLQFEDESQSLPASQASAVETQPMVMCEDTVRADGSSISGPKKKKTKQLHLEDNSEDSEVKASLASTYGGQVIDTEDVKLVLRENAESSVTQTSGYQTPTGERSRVNSADCKTEEDETHAEQMRGRKTARQQENEDEEQIKKSAEQKNLQEEMDAKEMRKEDEKGETGDLRMEAEEIENHQKNEDIKNEGAEKPNLEIEPQDEAEKKEEQEHQARGKRNKPIQEKTSKALEESRDEGAELKAPPRGRKTTRRTVTAEQQDSTLSNSDDFPARRTRSRSNSSNSVCSDKSISSLVTQEGKERGRGRGARGSQEAAAVGNRSSRRITAGQMEQPLSRSDSINSERSSVSSLNRGRGGRQRGRGRRTEPEPEITAPTVNKRCSRRSKAQESSSQLRHECDEDGAGSQQAGTSRGQQQANAAESEPADFIDERQSNQEEAILEKSPAPKRNVRGRGQKTAKTETLEKAGASAISDGKEVRNKRKGQKSEVEANTEEKPPKVSKGNVETQKNKICADRGNDAIPEVIPAGDHVRRTGRASRTLEKKNTQESLLEGERKGAEEVEVETSKRRAGGRRSAIQANRNEVPGDGTASEAKQEENVATSQLEQPQTPKSRPSRKRQASADSPSLAKTPRSSSGSPATSERRRAGSQAYKVLFTGVMDDAGERVLARLGGSLAKGVADMNCLVTDKVRRTVKFLCALAKGVPVVTTEWLEKSGKAGTFLSTANFLVKDPEQEAKFSFCLEESLKAAGRQPLLQGYKIHVTKSVKPEPPHMKDIISSSGATFLPKMPTSHKVHVPKLLLSSTLTLIF